MFKISLILKCRSIVGAFIKVEALVATFSKYGGNYHESLLTALVTNSAPAQAQGILAL